MDIELSSRSVLVRICVFFTLGSFNGASVAVVPFRSCISSLLSSPPRRALSIVVLNHEFLLILPVALFLVLRLRRTRYHTDYALVKFRVDCRHFYL